MPLTMLGVSFDVSQLWIKANQDASRGLYSSAIQTLESAIKSASYSSSDKQLLSVDIAACLEKLEKYKEAFALYSFVMKSAELTKVDIVNIVALKGLIRCKLALNEDARDEILLLKKWDPQQPASYILGNQWIIVPHISVIHVPDKIVLNFLEEMFSISMENAKKLHSHAVITSSGVSCFQLNDIFLKNLFDVGIKLSLVEVQSLLHKYSKEISINLPSADPSVDYNSRKLSSIESTCPEWVASWIDCYNMKNFLQGTIPVKINLLNNAFSRSSAIFFPELRARIALEKGILYETAKKRKEARASFLESAQSDREGLTRTSASAIFYTLRFAMEDKDLAFVRKVAQRAGRLYLFVPKISPSYSDNLILMGSDQDMLERFIDSVAIRGKELTGWTSPPKNILLSASGMTVFWVGFEKDLMSSPKLKTALTALKIYLGHGLFSTPPKGWLISAILQKTEVDDI